MKFEYYVNGIPATSQSKSINKSNWICYIRKQYREYEYLPENSRIKKRSKSFKKAVSVKIVWYINDVFAANKSIKNCSIGDSDNVAKLILDAMTDHKHDKNKRPIFKNDRQVTRLIIEKKFISMLSYSNSSNATLLERKANRAVNHGVDFFRVIVSSKI